MSITKNVSGTALYFYKNQKIKDDVINIAKTAASSVGETKLNRYQRRKKKNK
jgi:hypothetical protein